MAHNIISFKGPGTGCVTLTNKFFALLSVSRVLVDSNE